MRIAIYARVSTTDQHCAQQLRDLREYAAARKWQVQGEYVDHAVSGKADKQPAMNRLVDAARRRAIVDNHPVGSLRPACCLITMLAVPGGEFPRGLPSDEPQLEP